MTFSILDSNKEIFYFIVFFGLAIPPITTILIDLELS